MDTQMLVHDAAVELRPPEAADGRLLSKLGVDEASTATPCGEWVVVVDGERAGYLCVVSAPNELRVHALRFLPRFEGLGIRSTLVRALRADARRLGLPLRATIPAANETLQALYTAHGLEVRGADDGDVHLEAAPPQLDGPRRPRFVSLFRMRNA